MKEDLVLHNGTLLPKREFVIQPQNRSFKYGDGLFETIRVSDAFPVFYRAHHSRLVRGLDALQMTVPESFHFQYFKEKLLELIESYGLQNGVIRVQAFRSGEGSYVPTTSSFEWFAEVISDDFISPFFEGRQENYKVDIYETVKKAYSPISFFKSSNSQVYVLAAIEAKRKSLDNLLITNQAGSIIESVAENIFLFSKGRVITPPVDDGPIEGIMRTTIKKICIWNKIPLVEQSINMDDLYEAEEAFLTNGVKGIQPINQFREKIFETQFSLGLELKLNERVAKMLSQKEKI